LSKELSSLMKVLWEKEARWLELGEFM
jgi:hypothetical protein